MRVAIFVDSRFRDTLSCWLVCQELQKLRNKWETIVVSIDLWKETMQFFKPHVVVLNHAIGYRNQQIIKMADYSVVLPTEGRPNTKEQEQWFVEQQDGIADLYLSWNDTIAQQFKKTRSVTTGCPRFDVYHIDGLIDSREKAAAKYGLDPGKKTVGVFTSFPQAKFSFDKVNWNIQDWRDLGVDTISTRNSPLEFAQKEYKERRRFLTMVAAFIEMHDYQFIVKPHPMEDVIEIQQWATEHGVVCVTQDTIYNVIAACDFVINRTGCVTTLDAWLSNVGVLSFGEPEAPGIIAEIPHINNIREMLDATPMQANQHYLKACGVDSLAAQKVARAIAENVDSATTIHREVTISDKLNLVSIMNQHANAYAVPNPLAPPVGKAATANYINAIGAML